MATTEYLIEEVNAHNTKEDCWIVVNGMVLDVTKWLPSHPGGDDMILKKAGKDASMVFKLSHPDTVIDTHVPQYTIGKLVTEKSPPPPPASPSWLSKLAFCC
jgi:cytochrome b involved in lipid metabolism